MKNFEIFNIPRGVSGLLNVMSDHDIYTYQFSYQKGKFSGGPDWQLARHYRYDLIEVPQLDFDGPPLSVKDLVNSIVYKDGYYAILKRDRNLFGLVWSDYPFVSIQQDYVIKGR